MAGGWGTFWRLGPYKYRSAVARVGWETHGLGTSRSTNNPKARVLTRNPQAAFRAARPRCRSRRRWTRRARPRPHSAADNARVSPALSLGTGCWLLSRPGGWEGARRQLVPFLPGDQRAALAQPGALASTCLDARSAPPRLGTPYSEGLGQRDRPARPRTSTKTGGGGAGRRDWVPRARRPHSAGSGRPCPRRPRLSPVAAGAARPRPRRCRRRGGSPRGSIAAPAPHLRRRARCAAGRLRELPARDFLGRREALRPFRFPAAAGAAGGGSGSAPPLSFSPCLVLPRPRSGPGSQTALGAPWPVVAIPHPSLPTRRRPSGFLGPPVSLHLAFLHWPLGASQRLCVLKVGLT